jgi:hypothetical protein
VLAGTHHKNRICNFKAGKLNPQDHGHLLALLNKAGWKVDFSRKPLKLDAPNEPPSTRTEGPAYWMYMVRNLQPASETAKSRAVKAYIVDSIRCEYFMHLLNILLQMLRHVSEHH